MNPTRRNVLSSIAHVGAAIGIGSIIADPDRASHAPSDRSENPFDGSRVTQANGPHVVAPLPFAASALRGISEKLITSHHGNNYAGAVKNLNNVEGELAKTTKETPAFLIGGMRQSELQFRNSMILHELYFGNLGGDGKPAGAIVTSLEKEHGSYAKFEERFKAMALSLGGGSGWAVLQANVHTGAIEFAWSGNHTQAGSSGVPLLVLDMYEHAYQMDYGAAAAKYVDAFFQNVHWEKVNARLARATQAIAAMKAP